MNGTQSEGSTAEEPGEAMSIETAMLLLAIGLILIGITAPRRRH